MPERRRSNVAGDGTRGGTTEGLTGAYIKLFLAPVLWGGSLVAGRIVTVGLPPFTITWVRFVLVTIFLLPVLRFSEGRLVRPTWSDLAFIIALSLTGVVLFNYFLFAGLRTVTAVRSGVLIALSPAVVALILWVFFRETVGGLGALGIVVAFLGAIVTITEGNIARAVAGGVSPGDFLLLGAVLAWSVYTITARYAMRRLTPLAVLTWSSAAGALLLTPVAAAERAIAAILAQPMVTWIAILYLSFGAAGLAYLWYYEGIKRVGASEAAIFLNLEPAAALILGAVILQEAVTLPVLIGAVLVLIGMYLVNRPRKERSPRVARPVSGPPPEPTRTDP